MFGKTKSVQRESIRTITTERGSDFVVKYETLHYIVCYEPENTDTVAEALLDFEYLASKGYFLAGSRISGIYVIFEKR
jgi:hypothetical protein